MGYLNDPKGSERLWAGGYLHTGDVGSIEPDGVLHITDRLKDIIKSGGEWISSIDLEDIILRLEGVARAAVIGIHDDKVPWSWSTCCRSSKHRSVGTTFAPM
jgi:fatty-acyl-CoA synthase